MIYRDLISHVEIVQAFNASKSQVAREPSMLRTEALRNIASSDPMSLFHLSFSNPSTSLLTPPRTNRELIMKHQEYKDAK